MKAGVRALGASAALLVGLGLLAYAAYIPAKAWLAQQLLENAWHARVATGHLRRPWPGADMLPVARLSQPRLGVSQIVLSGSSGRVLAFGPGHIVGTAMPGEQGNVVVSGHRDTHFRWLAALRDGDELLLADRQGNETRYRIMHRGVFDQSDVDLLAPTAVAQLRLITCYPFDAIDAGTRQRYVVTAVPYRI